MHLESQTATLCNPAELNRALTDLLAEELKAEVRRWPADVPILFGPDDARAVADIIVEVAKETGFDVKSAPLPSRRVLVFNPSELDGLAAALEGRISPTPDSVTPWERRTRLLELAGRIPALLNRAGQALVRTRDDVDLIPFDKLDHLAQLAHLGYRQVAADTSNATGSEYAIVDYELLPELVRSSNVAQVLDIPVKLALVGLRFAPSPAVGCGGPVEYEFTPDEVELLAYQEHRRWAHFQIRNGRSAHNWNKPWDVLPDGVRTYDRWAVQLIPLLLRRAGLIMVEDSELRTRLPAPPTLVPAEGKFWRKGEVYAERLAEPRSWLTARGDALDAEAGDWWVRSVDPEQPDARSVKPDAFARSYSLIEGDRYQRVGSVHARQVADAETVQTSEGPARAEVHDWVITDAAGATWPVSEKGFENLYDSAPPPKADAKPPLRVPCGQPEKRRAV